jgi:hypothetical protein
VSPLTKRAPLVVAVWNSLRKDFEHATRKRPMEHKYVGLDWAYALNVER